MHPYLHPTKISYSLHQCVRRKEEEQSSSKFSESQQLSTRATELHSITMSAHTPVVGGGYVPSSYQLVPLLSTLQWTSADHIRNTMAAWRFSSELPLILWKLDLSNRCLWRMQAVSTMTDLLCTQVI